MTHYIFYDFETTGLSHSYDQVLQFAAIVTDENFQKLPEGSLGSGPIKNIVGLFELKDSHVV